MIGMVRYGELLILVFCRRLSPPNAPYEIGRSLQPQKPIALNSTDKNDRPPKKRSLQPQKPIAPNPTYQNRSHFNPLQAIAFNPTDKRSHPTLPTNDRTQPHRKPIALQPHLQKRSHYRTIEFGKMR